MAAMGRNPLFFQPLECPVALVGIVECPSQGRGIRIQFHQPIALDIRPIQVHASSLPFARRLKMLVSVHRFSVQG